MNTKKIIVTDFETSSVDPHTTCPLQLSAVAIDPIKLEIIPNSQFDSYILPDEYGPDFYKNNKATMDWHAQNKNCTVGQILKTIEASPPEKVVFQNYVNYLKGFHTKPTYQTKHTAPIMAGYNIFNFDCIIMKRLCEKYGYVDAEGSMKIFSPRDSIDIMKIVWLWFEGNNELENYKMDTLRQYFGMDMANAHDGLKDCIDEAEILIKFLKLKRMIFNKISFKGAN